MPSTLGIEQLLSNLPTQALCEAPSLPFPHLSSGKVREIYDLGDRLLILATDRLSAFDVILPDGIPGKGILLTQLSLYGFEQAAACVPCHLVASHTEALASVLEEYPHLIPRSMLVQKLKPLPIEAVVRGYLAGSGWKAYQETGKLFDHPLPKGLRQSDALPTPLLTPTTKAQSAHDEPLSAKEAKALLGAPLFQKVRDVSLELFRLGSIRAQKAGFILADTKFEFGQDTEGRLYLIDEVFTSDSSRYWRRETYQGGRVNEAFDKQYVREYLETLDWDKTPPGPHLPREVITTVQQRYQKVLSLFAESA